MHCLLPDHQHQNNSTTLAAARQLLCCPYNHHLCSTSTCDNSSCHAAAFKATAVLGIPPRLCTACRTESDLSRASNRQRLLPLMHSCSLTTHLQV
jgi:hypothetical protein